jgi:hypothetical protein
MELLLQLPLIILWIAVLYTAADFSPEMVAIATVCLFAARCVVMMVAVGNIMKIPLDSFIRALRGGVLLTLIMALVSVSLRESISALNINSLAQLLLMMGMGGAAYLTAFFLLASVLVDESWAIYIKQLGDRLPHWAKPLIRSLIREQKR